MKSVVKTGEGVSLRFLKKQSGKLFSGCAAREAFEESILKPKPVPGAIIWLAERSENPPFAVEKPIAWQPAFVDRVAKEAFAGRHAWHSEGRYYCLDYASVFSASVVSVCGERLASPYDFIDVCSAPGGKAVFTWRALKPRVTVCNEVIGKRLPALISNLKRCRIRPAVTTNMDSGDLAANAQHSFGLVVVDAPCSGQSLLARGEQSPGAFHPATINMNSNRQKRIVANSAKILQGGGYLAYMTCTYAREENEGVVEWLLKKFKNLEAVEVAHLSDYQSHLSDFPCYRLWPQSGIGAGAFTVLFKNNSAESSELDCEKLRVVWRAE